MKVNEAQDNTGSSWCGYEDLSQLLKQYVPNVRTLIAASTPRGLTMQLNQVAGDGQYFIPLNINCLSQNFEIGKNNHWAGLYIVKSFDRLINITYIDPMGKAIHQDLASTITNTLRVNEIDQPLLKNPVQFVQLDSSNFYIKGGNDTDCGPFLIYCVASIVKGKRVRQDIKTPEQSISLGQYLREAFSKGAIFEEIHQTITVKRAKSSKMLEDEEGGSKSDTASEKELFSSLQSGITAPLPTYKEERGKIISQIYTSYEAGLEYYQAGDFECAEQELVKVLKPVLSKPSMKSIYVDIEDIKDQALDAIYHLGLICLNNPRYLNHYSKAAAIFQYCAGFAQKHGVSESNTYLNHAYKVEEKFLESLGKTVTAGNTNTLGEITSYKAELERIRTQAKQQSNKVREFKAEQIADFAQKVEEDYKTYIKAFVNNGDDRDQNVGLVQKMLYNSFQQLGVPPCEYSIIALGSLAGGRMTPWSDLEFAILIKEDNEEYKEYFRNLTKLLHIKVVNIGETLLRSVGIEALNNFRTAKAEDDWFWDEVTNCGFSFDGPEWHACKLPLGRQGNYKVAKKLKDGDGIEKTIIEEKTDYELILTPKQMAEFQKEVHGWFRSDIYLVQSLRLVSLIDGSQALLDNYRQEVIQAEDQQIIKERALAKLTKDLSNFALKLGDEEEGKLINIKNDIFRIEDRVIDDLANFYGIMAETGQAQLTAWDVIDRMLKAGVLNCEGAQHLKEAFSIATELRLATYCHNNGQKEGVSTYEPAVKHLSERQKKELLKETFYVKDTSILHYFYYVILKLQAITQDFCDQKYYGYGEISLKFDSLFDNNNHTKGLVHTRFLEYDRAIKCLQIAEQEQPQNLKILEDLYFLYKRTGTAGKPEEMVSLAEKMLTLRSSKHKATPDHPNIGISYHNLGVAYHMGGNYEQAQECYEQALDIRLKAYKHAPNHPDIAKNYINLGGMCHTRGDYEQAIKYHTKALKIQFEVYKHYPNHPDIAVNYNNFGIIYRAAKDYKQAIKFHNKALMIQFEVYKYSPNHPEIADSYCDLGDAYYAKGEYEPAVRCYSQALAIRLKAYKYSPNHLDIAKSYSKLGDVSFDKEEYKLAINWYLKALEIEREVYEYTPNHPDIAASYNRLGHSYIRNNEYEYGINCLKKVLNMLTEIPEQNLTYPNIAVIYSNLGEAYRNAGEYKRALESCNKALEIQREVYKGSFENVDTAKTYVNLGAIYDAMGDYDRAIEYHNKGLGIQCGIYPTNPNHPDIAVSYNNLGTSHYNKREYGAAIGYYEKALKIRIKAHESSPNHSDIVSSYNRLGDVCHSVGAYERALEYYKQGLVTQFPEYRHSSYNNQDIIGKYCSLGSKYNQAGECEFAIKRYNQALEVLPNIYGYGYSLNTVASPQIYQGLGVAYFARGDFGTALEYIVGALRIFIMPEQEAGVCQRLYCSSLVQLGNKVLLEGDVEKARSYYKGLGYKDEQIDFHSPDFIGLQLREAEVGYQYHSLSAAINCQKVLIKLDSRLKYGNHYHNLACFYACLGDRQEANEAFTYALTHPNARVTGELHIEYAQFLILNARHLGVGRHKISTHIYSAIYSENAGGLQYGKIEHNTVCDSLQDLIKQENTTIRVNPKVLAYHLLAVYPEYLKEDESIEDLLESFANYCDSLQEGISFKLLAETYALLDNEELALKYSTQAELIKVIKAQTHTQAPILPRNIYGPTKLSEKVKEVEREPLIQAIIDNDQDMVLALIQRGVNPRQPMGNGTTPIHIAYLQRNLGMIKTLLNEGANINAKDDTGKTPLHCLLELQDISEEDKLKLVQDKDLRKLYNFDLQDNSGKSIFDYALNYCSETAASIILSLCLASNVTNNAGTSTLGDNNSPMDLI